MAESIPRSAISGRARERPSDGLPRGVTMSDDVEDLDETVDHIRGQAGTHVILEYGDYECPYTRVAYRQIQQVEQQLEGHICLASGTSR
jgi:hypothetical protein